MGICINTTKNGAHGGIEVKALCHKLAGRGFHSQWRHWNF